VKYARAVLARGACKAKNEIIVRMLDAGLETGVKKIAEGQNLKPGLFGVRRSP
jgi:hypothetical protein